MTQSHRVAHIPVSTVWQGQLHQVKKSCLTSHVTTNSNNTVKWSLIILSSCNMFIPVQVFEFTCHTKVQIELISNITTWKNMDMSLMIGQQSQRLLSISSLAIFALCLATDKSTLIFDIILQLHSVVAAWIVSCIAEIKKKRWFVLLRIFHGLKWWNPPVMSVLGVGRRALSCFQFWIN